MRRSLQPQKNAEVAETELNPREVAKPVSCPCQNQLGGYAVYEELMPHVLLLTLCESPSTNADTRLDEAWGCGLKELIF